MNRKKQSRSCPDAAVPLTRRLAILCKRVWADNKSHMARDLGLSHSLVSRVLAGKQEPSSQLLVNLARWPAPWANVGERGAGSGGHVGPRWRCRADRGLIFRHVVERCPGR